MIKLDLPQNYQPTVAVIIPYYNGSKWIERALKSIYNQSIPPNEVIIINDGSLGEESIFLKSLQEKYDFVILNKENGGQGSARNSGVNHSKSDFISFLDQDDFYFSGHIEDLINALPKKDMRFGFVYGDVCIANENGETFFRGITYKHGPHPKRSVIECIKKDMFILPSATLISREAFLSVNGFDEQFRGYEDDDLFLRMFLSGFSSYFITNIVTVWCVNTQSTSYSIHMLRSRFYFFKKILKMFPDHPQQNQFFFADYIVPRFGELFSSESINAILRSCELREEINAMLNFYCKTVWNNRFVARRRKIKTFLVSVILTKISPFIIRFVYQILQLPILGLCVGRLIGRKKAEQEFSVALLRRKYMAKDSIF